MSGKHSNRLLYYAPQGESTHPRDSVSPWSAYSQVPVPPSLQPGMGHVTSLQEPPMGRSYPPAFHQMVPSQVANVTHRPYHFNFSHFETPELVIATSSHYKDLSGVHHTVGGPYYR